MTGAAARQIAAALIALHLLAGSARALPRLAVDGEATFGEPVVLAVTARNQGDQPAEAVHPETVFAHEMRRGEPVRLAPGEAHTWRLELPPPRSPGTYPARIDVHYTDAGGIGHAQPSVALVRTPGAPGSPLGIRLEVGSIARTGSARLRVTNPTNDPAAGRVVTALPDALHTGPQSQPVQVPAGGERVVPLSVQNRAAIPQEAYPVYAWFEYSLGGTHFTALASGTMRADANSDGTPVPVVVGGVFTAAVLAVVVVAIRRTRRER
jgi:hypothetical protein